MLTGFLEEPLPLGLSRGGVYSHGNPKRQGSLCHRGSAKSQVFSDLSFPIPILKDFFKKLPHVYLLHSSHGN